MERKIILLVEDNADDEELTLRALRKNTFIDDVVVARDGTEALDHLFGAEHLPDLVILDLKLPKVDGIEVLRNLRAHERGKLLPVVVLTSSDATVTAPTAISASRSISWSSPPRSARWRSTG